MGSLMDRLRTMFTHVHNLSKRTEHPTTMGAADLFGGQSIMNDPVYQRNKQSEADVYKDNLDGDYSGTAEEMDKNVGLSKREDFISKSLFVLLLGFVALIIYRSKSI